MELYAFLVVFGTIIILASLVHYQETWTWPIVRARIESTWPMGSSHIKEGFQNSMPLEKWLPTPESLVKPSSDECPPTLWSAAPHQAGKVVPNYNLLGDWFGSKQDSIAYGPTSQKCYEVDWARGLERAGSYAQRTNNYRRGYPDSCSAPNHDLVLDFYKEKPSEGPYQV